MSQYLLLILIFPAAVVFEYLLVYLGICLGCKPE
jgi:hypothetical protein